MSFKSELAHDGSAVFVKRTGISKGKVLIWYSIVPRMLQWIRSGEGAEFDDPILKVTVSKDAMVFDDRAGGVLTVSTSEFPQFLEQLGSDAVSMFENIGKELGSGVAPVVLEEVTEPSSGKTSVPLQLVKPVAARVYRSIIVDCPICHLRLELASGESPSLMGYMAKCSNPECGQWLYLTE